MHHFTSLHQIRRETFVHHFKVLCCLAQPQIHGTAVALPQSFSYWPRQPGCFPRCTGLHCILTPPITCSDGDQGQRKGGATRSSSGSPQLPLVLLGCVSVLHLSTVNCFSAKCGHKIRRDLDAAPLSIRDLIVPLHPMFAFLLRQTIQPSTSLSEDANVPPPPPSMIHRS